MRPDVRAIAVVLAAALALNACGGGEDRPNPRLPRHRPRRRAVEAPPNEAPPEGPSDGSSPAINSITADPADGTLMIGTGPALYRVPSGEGDAEKVTGQLSALRGRGHGLGQPRRALRRPR